MLQFLLYSTTFSRKVYTVVKDLKKENVVSIIDNILKRRENAVIWPVFTKEDIDELCCMDASLKSLLKEIKPGTETCRIRYNGRIFEVNEIALSHTIRNYWKIITNSGNYSLDPNCIEFICPRPPKSED